MMSLLFRGWFFLCSLCCCSFHVSSHHGRLGLCYIFYLVRLHCREQIPCKASVKAQIQIDSLPRAIVLFSLPVSMVDYRIHPFFSDFLIAHPFINAHSLGLACYCIRHVLSEEVSSFLMSWMVSESFWSSVVLPVRLIPRTVPLWDEPSASLHGHCQSGYRALLPAGWSLALDVAGLNAMQLQNLAALAAAASAAQNTPSGTSALTTSSSPLSVLTSSGKRVVGAWGPLWALGRIPREDSVILENG